MKTGTIVIILFLVCFSIGCGTKRSATPVPVTLTPLPPTVSQIPPTNTQQSSSTHSPVPATATPPPPTATMTIEPSPSPTAQPTPTATLTLAPSHTWQKNYRVNGSEVVHDVLMADDGGYYIVGTKNLVFEPEQNGDVYLIKTNAAGEKLWEKTYGGPGLDEGNTILPTNDGQLMIIGYTASFGADGIDMYMIKVDHEGNELWSKTLGGPLDEMGGGQLMADGSFILGGNIVDPNDIVADPGAAGYAGYAGRSNIFIARTDGDGNQLWTQTFGGGQNVLATSGIQSPDSGFVILATIISYPDPANHIYLLKVDNEGQEVWSHIWEKDNASGYALIQTSDGGYLITGPYVPEGSEKEDFLFIKTDSAGNEIWRSSFGNPDMIDYGVVLVEAADGGYVSAGEWVKDYFVGDSDLVIVKIDAQGQFVWQQKIETNAHHMLAKILQHPDGDYIIATSIVSGATFDFNIMLIKIDAPVSPPATIVPPLATTVPPTVMPTISSPSPTSTLQPGPSSSNDAPISLDTVVRLECLRKLDGHDNRLYGLAFSPDGLLFGSYSLDGVVQVWDSASWQVIQEFTDPNATGWRLFFLADNKHISSGSGTVWNIATGELEHTLSRGHRVAFSQDGVWMADNGGRLGIALWRVDDWQLERDIVTSHTGDHLAFSFDNQLLASSGSDFAAKVLDVTTGQELYTLQGHQNILHGLAFSPDGRWLASASMDTTVKIWDIQTGQLFHTLQTGGELFDVAFSPDSSLVAAALNNKTVELWDVAGGQRLRTLKHGGEVVSVAFSPDGTLLASGAYDRKIYLWGIR